MAYSSRNARTLLVLACCSLAASAGGAAGFGLHEPEPPAAVTSAEPALADWSRARLLPAAFLLAGEAARAEAAAGQDTLDKLRPGPDGSVDLALATVIDRTLAANLDLLVRSYTPALAEETVKARESIFDPLLRFTVSLLSSTNPTAATLAGAEVLSQDQASWSFDAMRLLEWGGRASLGFSNRRDKSNNVFATLNPAYATDLTFGMSQPLLRDFGSSITRREIAIASNDRAASREGFRGQVMRKVTEAIDAYWVLYAQIENLKVQRQGLALAEDLLRINKTRVEVGTMAPLDVTSAEAEVARNRELVIVAEADVRNAEDQLRMLMNVPQDSPLWGASLRPVDAPVIGTRDIDVDQAIRVALANRPELRQQDLLIENGKVRLEYARNQLKPGLGLDASYGLAGLGGTQIIRSGFGQEDIVRTVPGGYGDALDQLTSFDFDTWRLQLTLDLPVFNQAAQAGHAQALLVLRRDELTREALEQAVAVDVRRLVRAAKTSFEEIDAAGATRTLQERRLEAENKKFEHGLSTNFEVQQAQKDLTAARRGEVLAITTYLRALAALEQAEGVVLDTHNIRITE